jgi:hypothetical protein
MPLSLSRKRAIEREGCWEALRAFIAGLYAITASDTARRVVRTLGEAAAWMCVPHTCTIRGASSLVHGIVLEPEFVLALGREGRPNVEDGRRFAKLQCEEA